MFLRTGKNEIPRPREHMKIEQFTARRVPEGAELAPLVAIHPQLVLAFGSVKRMTEAGLLDAL
jgi:hypothetical protein